MPWEPQLEGEGGAGKGAERAPATPTLDSKRAGRGGEGSQLELGGPRGVYRVKNEMQGLR